MFRLLHSSHRVNPISLDFDSGVRLVKLLPAGEQHAVNSSDKFDDDNCSTECLRRASSEVASFCEPRDAEMIDIQLQGSFACSVAASPLTIQLDGDDSRRLVSTPLMQTRASSRTALASTTNTPTTTSTTSAAAASEGHLQSCLDELRAIRPRRFYEICRVHLAFVTDVPADFLQDLIDGASGATPADSARVAPRNFVERVCRSMRYQQNQQNCTRASSTAATTAAAASAVQTDDESLNSEILSSIQRVIRLLEGRLDAEGIFRKSGQVGRQRQLRQFLLSEPRRPQSLEAAVSELRCCVHDIAGVLKASLGDLNQPLLTERLRPYFLQVAELHQNRLDENGNPAGPESSLAASRQLRGYRILLQLLPRPNFHLLRSLLQLLRKVADLPRTRMTPENLGTVFGPLLLCPKQMQSSDNLHRFVSMANEAVAYMIRYVEEIFKVPEHLAIDAARGIERSRCRSRSISNHQPNENSIIADHSAIANASGASTTDEEILSDSEEAVDVCVAFVDRAAASRVNGLEYTQVQVAELYAAVQAMPESSRKAALVRKFNAANNGGLAGPSPSFKRRAGDGGSGGAGSPGCGTVVGRTVSFAASTK